MNGKTNYLAIAHVGIMDFSSIALSMNRQHYTNAGIKVNKTFNANSPSASMVREMDYCGLVSGKTQNKAALFKTFFEKLTR